MAGSSQWMLDAACRDALDENNGRDLFTGESEDYPEGKRRYCAGCPVAWECFRFSVRVDMWSGVFGGCTPLERQRITDRAGRDAFKAKALHLQHINRLNRIKYRKRLR